jgi:hypothetical protein
MDGWTDWAAGESRVFWVCRYLMLVVSLGMLLPPSIYAFCVLFFFFSSHAILLRGRSTLAQFYVCYLAEKRGHRPFTL